MTRNQFITYCFIALLFFVVFQVLLILSPFKNAIFWAGIFAFGFYPIYARLKKKMPGRGTLSAFLMTLLIILMVVVPIILILVNVVKEAIQLSQFIYEFIRAGKLEQMISDIRHIHWVEKLETRVTAWEPVQQNLTNTALNLSKNLGNYAASQLATFTKNILFISVNAFFMFFMLFMFFKDGEAAYNFIYHIAPLEEKTKKAIFGQINETLAAVLRGQILTSLTQAVLLGIIFAVLGLPLPIFFAAVTFILAMIPVAGAATVWLPFTIYLALNQHYQKAIILGLLGLFGISMVDNIIKPLLIGEKTKLPYFLLFFGILGGIQLYGLVGIFLAPVVLSLFFALVKIYQEREW